MQNLQEASALSAVLGNAGLTGLSGAATTYSTSAVPVSINGVATTKAAVSGGTTPTTNSTSAAALTVTAPATGHKAALVVWTVDTGGTERIRSDGFVTSLSGAEIILDFPDIPATEVPFAYHTLKAGTTVSGTWTFGSSNWNATGMTVGTVVNCSMIPHPSVVSVS